MKTINYRMLEDKNACAEHLTIFQATFGKGEVELSKKNLKIAWNVGLDVSFLTRFLPVGARAEYDRVINGAWNEYEVRRARVYNEAWAEYKRVCVETWDEYYRVTGEALIEILSRD